MGAHTSFFPTIFFAFFAIGLGIGSAFMPLLSIAMAEVPAADAGLASGIVNVSQQVAGALGLAVLGTIATNHTHALELAHHDPVRSLLAGYHLAFAIGAGCVTAGILVALALLRPPRRGGAELAVEPDPSRGPQTRPGAREASRLTPFSGVDVRASPFRRFGPGIDREGPDSGPSRSSREREAARVRRTYASQRCCLTSSICSQRFPSPKVFPAPTAARPTSSSA